MHIYVYICIHMYVNMYICMYICIYTSMNMHRWQNSKTNLIESIHVCI